MAHVAIHEIIANRYIQKHPDEIKDVKEFIKGSIVPDLNEEMTERRKFKDSSHYGRWSNGNVETNIDKFLEDENVDITKDYWKGYFLHLFTDYQFYNNKFNEEFEEIKKTNGNLREDYDYLFKEILERYNIILNKYTDKYVHIKEGEPRYIKLEKLLDFIEEISDINIDDKIKLISQKGMEGIKSMNTRINLAGIEMKNPVTVASGTFGYGREFSEFFDLSKLGGIITKGTSLKPKSGNKPSRVCETASGMLNSIGLQNPGVEYFAENDLPFLRKFDTAIIVNACGSTVEEYVELCKILNTLDIDGVELNLSCPNVKAGCMAFGNTYEGVKHVTSEVRKVLDKPLIVKLTPNVTDIASIAKGVEDGGADGVSLINTLLGMKIDIDKRKPVLANNTGGLSGPAIKPVAVRMVYQVAQAVNIPILGMGGIINGDDAIEFILAGATAISIGAGNFINPYTSVNTVKGIEDYMKKYNIDDINDIIGKVQMN